MALIGRAAWDEKRGMRLIAVPIVAATRIYDGALVAIAAGGALENWAGDTVTAGNTSFFLGVARITQQTGVLAADGESKLGTTALDVEAAVDISGINLIGVTITGASAANVGNLVYASDENTFTFTATPGGAAIGWCSRFVSATNSDLVLFTPGEYRAHIAI